MTDLRLAPTLPAQAGIETGDVILKFDGKEVSTMRGLPRIVAQTPIGKSVDVEALRKGEKKNFKVVVGRLSEDDKPATPAKTDNKSEEKATPGRALIGLKLIPLTDELRRKHGIDKKIKGLLVTEADPQSPAAQKGIKAGDVIAYSGNSGNSTGPHLHFEVRPGGGETIDPLSWLRSHGLDPTG